MLSWAQAQPQEHQERRASPTVAQEARQPGIWWHTNVKMILFQ